MFTYDFQLQTGDKNKGTVYLPHKDSTNIPVIIYCHGWGGSRRLWLPTEKLCERVLSANMALVTFDFFGCGDTGGDYAQMTYARWKNNLSDVFDWCLAQPFADPNKIGCYAFSSGSTAALRFAAADSRPAFIVSVGTCISAHIGMGGGGSAKIFADRYESLLSGGKEELFGIPFGVEFFIDTVSGAPIHTLQNIRCPVLFLQGLADNPYRCADAMMAYQLMKRENLPAAYAEFPGGNHELENVIDEALPRLFEWLASFL
ncbi:MAG: hypothetical protein FWF49_03100 [Oscillospiraceae bacterium]|nr:hypothetical protein [Oscillospiraceae bacterium]